MEIKEVHEANNGRDPFPTLVQRARQPKIFVAKTFPSVWFSKALISFMVI